jgi:hypothetical protein
MKVFIVTKNDVIQKAFMNEMDADKYIVSNGQYGLDKIIVDLEQ